MKTQLFRINLKDRSHKTVIVRGVLSILVLLLLLYPLASCVETAECDETVACTDGNVCYDLKCQTACTQTSDCRENESCEPCLENFGAGISDHCFTDTRFSCIARESIDE